MYNENNLSHLRISIVNIISILNFQKEIIENYMYSSDQEDKKLLYSEYLKSENNINEIYENMPNIYSNNIKMPNFIQEHFKNYIYNIVYIIKKWCFDNLALSFYIMLFIGALFCCPYFFKIGLIPDISIDSAIPTLFFISTVGLLIGTLIYVGFVFQNQLSFNILINIDNKKINNIIKFLVSISWVIFFAIIMTPFAPDFYFIQSISEYILNNFNIILIVYVVILLIFCLVFFISKSTNKFPNIILYFIITVYFDFFILYAVYLNYNNINLSFLVISMFILFLLKIINLSKEPLNKLIISLSSIFIFFTICLISPNFVRGVKLANYKDDFTIKKEFVPKPILNLPNCFYSYNEACTYNLTNEEDKITIKNLLVRVKSDGRYYFRANMNLKDDFNLTKSILKTDKDEDEKSIDIKKRTSKILKIDENTTKNTYFIYNSDSNVTEVKNYHKLFLNFTKDKNIGLYYDFHVHEKNIVN
ncbi:hypothetical protein F7P64_02240 [Campylobacter sputorum subsp. sputorum]|nr:hypothetical protein F7P64_02240 [Campylobacter sputorum subsp. sputorum]